MDWPNTFGMWQGVVDFYKICSKTGQKVQNGSAQGVINLTRSVCHTAVLEWFLAKEGALGPTALLIY